MAIYVEVGYWEAGYAEGELDVIVLAGDASNEATATGDITLTGGYIIPEGILSFRVVTPLHVLSTIAARQTLLALTAVYTFLDVGVKRDMIDVKPKRSIR